jgi:hypothetical protein
LKAVSPSYTGLKLEALDGWWSTFIRRARDEMLRLLDKHEGGVRLSEENLLVGQHEHLGELKKLLGVEQQGASLVDGAACVAESWEVGIVGMGEVGKSTMAKMLYDDPDVRYWFGGKLCFLNFSELTIRAMQTKILKNMCEIDVTLGPEEGRARIRERLSCEKVLIILDDVWKDTTKVVRKMDVGAGSCFLKTSRVEEAISGDTHGLEALDVGPARELLCWHAFGVVKPPEELVVLAEKAAETCGRLPLAIWVLGRQLAGERD